MYTVHALILSLRINPIGFQITLQSDLHIHRHHMYSETKRQGIHSAQSVSL